MSMTRIPLIVAGAACAFLVTGFAGAARRATLIQAAKSGDLETARGLLDGGASPDETDGAGRTALLWAANAGKMPPFPDMLSHRGPGLEPQRRMWASDDVIFFAYDEDDIDRPYPVASAADYTALAKLLIAKGASVDAAYGKGVTALRLAVHHDNRDLVEALIAANADAKNVLPDAKTVEMAEYLLSHGALLDGRNEWGGTALMQTGNSGNIQLARWLLGKGADVLATDKNGRTAGDIAAKRNHPTLAAMLSPDAERAAPAAPDAGLARRLASVDAKLDALAKAKAEPIPPAAEKASDADRPTYRAAEDANKFALIIGISQYSDLPPAAFAEQDAKAVREHLLALGYPERNVISLLGAKASGTAIKKYVDTWLPRVANDASTVFVYYSGHGAPDPQTGQAYLVPWDGDPQFLADTGYPIARLYKKLNALKARRVLVALDSCFSGTGGRSVIAKGTRPLVARVELGEAGGKVIALTASAADQVSGTLDEQGHGLFTYYLMKGLNGGAKDASGRVTMLSLYDYMTPKVADAARRQNRDQSPQLSGAGAGETELRASAAGR